MSNNTKGERRYGLRIAISAIVAIAAFVGGILIFAVVVPNYFGTKCPNISEWLFNDTEQLAEIIGEGASSVAVLIALKATSWLLTAVAMVALFFLGSSIHNKKPKFNPNALATGKSVYLLAYEIFKSLSNKTSDDVFRAVRVIAEKLRTESEFGRADDEATRQENEIYSSLNELKSVISNLASGSASEEDVLRICKAIEGRLAMRRELMIK